MLAGLVLTTISTLTMRAALFQRKSRSGWLEELDGIREDALEAPEDGVAPVGDADDIWTDLRDGGEYSDPHEISSLYADDATPDRPVSKPTKPAAKPARASSRSTGRSSRAKARDEEPALPPPPAVEPLAPAAAMADADDIWTTTHDAPTGTGATNQYDDQIWVQPAPHPIRPSEMWHPAELAPAPLGTEASEPHLAPVEEGLPSDLEDQAIRERFAPSASRLPRAFEDVVPPLASEPAATEPATVAPIATPPIAEPIVEPAAAMPAPAAAAMPVEHEPVAEVAATEAEAPSWVLEAELVAAADVTVIGDAPFGDAVIHDELDHPIPTDAQGRLIAGPVPRRVRRDRPQRLRASLPATGALGSLDQQIDHPLPEFGPDGELLHDQTAPSLDRGDQSPLPVQPLPPAALPTRSNRMPGIESLPATPSSVVAPRTVPFDEPAAADVVGPASTPMAPEAPEVPPADHAFDPTALVVEEPPAAEPIEAEAPAAAELVEAPAAVELAVAADGIVPVPGTIVRVGAERGASAWLDADGVLVELRRGWCWASPGDGAARPLRIDIPNGRLTVSSGATALAVVEADGSVFIIVAAGTADLRRGDDGAPVERGTIVMIDPAGNAQTDRASDAEIESDPIVAENLSLDAEL